MGRFQFAVVVDIIEFGNKVPGCRGEELIATCAQSGACQLHSRKCHVVTLNLTVNSDPQEVLDKLRAELEDFSVISNAPDAPVLLRVIAVKLAAEVPANSACPTLPDDVSTAALGCAYSCPVQLDDVDEVFVSLDALDARCENAMRVCAGSGFLN